MKVNPASSAGRLSQPLPPRRRDLVICKADFRPEALRTSGSVGFRRGPAAATAAPTTVAGILRFVFPIALALALSGPAPAKSDDSLDKLYNGLGYDAGPADGLMGSRTRSAILAFQRDNDLPGTGQVEVYLPHHLKKVAAARKARSPAPPATANRTGPLRNREASDPPAREGGASRQPGVSQTEPLAMRQPGQGETAARTGRVSRFKTRFPGVWKTIWSATDLATWQKEAAEDGIELAIDIAADSAFKEFFLANLQLTTGVLVETIKREPLKVYRSSMLAHITEESLAKSFVPSLAANLATLVATDAILQAKTFNGMDLSSHH